MELSGCLKKQKHIKETFLVLRSQEEKYQRIIQIGRTAPKMSSKDQVKKNLVPGCQSLLYIKTECKQGLLFLQASSDALISAGLAQLLIQVYNNEPPAAVFKYPPLFLKEIGLLKTLSPNRTNGLKNIYQKLQNACLKLLIPE